MEYLIKQSRRVKFSDQGSGNRIQPHKNTSFKEEKKRSQNWFGKQMNQDYDPNEVEKATAVAAAAYAVVSVTDSNILDKAEHSRPSFTRIKSQKEVTRVPSLRPETSKMDDDITVSTPNKQTSGKYSMTNSEIEEVKEPETAVKAVDPSPSITRTPTFTDKPKVNKVPTFADDQLRTTKEIKPAESIKLKPDPVPEIKMPKSEIKMPKSEIPSTPKPAISPGQLRRQASTVPGKGLGGTEADSWERAQLAKIKNRYEEVEARIVSWENEKKTKSRRRLDKTESELERKRLKALERFRSEIDDINQIVDGARSKAKERRTRDELKAKEKANTYRKTGKPPSTCSCF